MSDENYSPDQEARDLSALMRWAVATGRIRTALEEPGLGDGIREARMERRRVTAELALRAGVPKEKWLQWEADQEIPSEEELVRIVAALELESAFDLWKRWREAPRRHLALALQEPERKARVARSVDPLAPFAPVSEAHLAIQNLDHGVRAGLEEWCRSQGRPHDEEGLAAALQEAQTLEPVERERWIWQVNSFLRPF